MIIVGKSFSEIRDLFQQRIHVCDVEAVAGWAGDSDENFSRLYSLAFSSDERVAYNALWCLSHCDDLTDIAQNRVDELIDLVMAENHNGKKRLLLTIMESLRFKRPFVRTDFLDFCLSKITSADQPYSVRALCLKLAFAQCRNYPELIDELKLRMEMLECSLLPPGLKSAFKNVSKRITRLNL